MILAYARILPDASRVGDYPPGGAISLAAFSEHIHFIRKHLSSVGLGDYCRKFLIGEKVDEPTVILTVDGGYFDFFERAAPQLEDLDISGTLFLPSTHIGTFEKLYDDRVVDAANGIFTKRENLIAAFPDDDMPPECSFVIDLLVSNPGRDKFVQYFVEKVDLIEDGLEPALVWLEWLGGVSTDDDDLERPLHMTWAHAGGLAEIGWEIGCLAGSRRDAVSAESNLTESFRTVQRNLNRAPTAFCHPDGQYDDASARYARKAGFLCGVTNYPGKADAQTDIFNLPRLIVGQHNAPDARRFESLLSFLR